MVKAKTSFLVTLSILGSLLGSFVLPVQAATSASLYISPSSKTIAVGDTFNAALDISSPTIAMNAISSTITFPTNLLQIENVSKVGSIMSLWVKEPSYSNSTGTVNFDSVVLNPGFTGHGANVLTITFKAIAQGTATVKVSSALVLANDGSGTAIPTGIGNGTYTIGPQPVQVVPPPNPVTAASELPNAPDVSSPTHPDQNAWYAVANAKFHWTPTTDISGVSEVLDQSAATIPAEKSEGLFGDKSFNGLADGVWYFHVRYQNSQGWGPTATYSIHIDNTPPATFDVHTSDGSDAADHRPYVWIVPVDATSGVDHVLVQVDSQPAVKVNPDSITQSKPFSFNPLAPGTDNVVVTLIDRAGNITTGSGSVTTSQPVPPHLDTPADVIEGDTLSINGETYANVPVTVYVTDPGGRERSQNVTSGPDGLFSLQWPLAMRVGNYSMTAEATAPGGLATGRAPNTTFTVQPGLAFELSQLTQSYNLYLLVSLIILLLLLLLVILLGIRVLRLQQLLAAAGDKGWLALADKTLDKVHEQIHHERYDKGHPEHTAAETKRIAALDDEIEDLKAQKEAKAKRAKKK